MKLISIASLCGALVSSNAAIWEFDLGGRAGPGLNGGNVVDSLPDSFASGKELSYNEITGILYDDVAKTLEFHVGWGSHSIVQGTDLKGIYISSGLYGPATENENAAGPVYSFTTASGYMPMNDSGGKTAFIHTQIQLVDIGNYTVAQQEADLLGSKFYFSIASGAFENGEIRGQLLSVIPEPEHYAAIAGIALLGFAGYRKFRRNAQPA